MNAWTALPMMALMVAQAIGAAAAPMPGLAVSTNGRYFVQSDGVPFFWLGDTAWHLFGKSVREDGTNQPSVTRYFATRAVQGFTVVQSVMVRETEGGPARNEANAYGYEPFIDGDAARPRVGPGAFDDYWDHVGWCIDEAARHGLRMAALPVWLQNVADDDPLVRDPKAAYRYGRFLGTRWGRSPSVIWVLGGDAWGKGRNVDTPSRLALVRAMAEGIADGATGADAFDGKADWRAVLMTFHPPGGNHSSGEWLHDEPWLDFNMIQTTTRFSFDNWRTVQRDFARTPPKPAFDAEVAYEESLSLRKTERQDIRIRPWDARRAAWWNVLSGGCGHTYGHRSFIGWMRQGETYKHGAHIPWYEQLDAPGATQMIHLRRLVESCRFHDHAPAPELLDGDPGGGDAHVQAARSADGRVAIVYTPLGQPVRFRADRFGAAARAAWYDPRTGETTEIGSVTPDGTRTFHPPSSGVDRDWVLVVQPAGRDIRLDADIPAGNGRVVAREGDMFVVEPDLRDTKGWWFHFNFRLAAPPGRPVTVVFAEKNPVGVRGPAVSSDGGRTWSWMGRDAVKRTERNGKPAWSIVAAVPAGAADLRLAFAPTYLQSNLREWLEANRTNEALLVSDLCRSRKGRAVEMVRAGCLDESKARGTVLLSARHHACESMASYALEGFLDAVLADDDDGRRWRKRWEVAVLPFADKDGVEDGDQGKNRKPHDHNRDYNETPLYPEVAAWKKTWEARKESVVFSLDLHCPYISGTWNDRVYIVGSPKPEHAEEERAFARRLEQSIRGAIPFRAADCYLPSGKAWNTPSNFSAGRSNSGWARDTFPNARFAGTIEIAYADALGVEVNAASARAFGRDLARAVLSCMENPP